MKRFEFFSEWQSWRIESVSRNFGDRLHRDQYMEASELVELLELQH
jgi:hypothetical protein